LTEKLNIKTLYFFPFKRFPVILYQDRQIFRTRLFNVFYNKLFPDILLLKVRRDSILFGKIFEMLFSNKVNVPNNDIRLIYYGYDRICFFEFDDRFRIKDNVWYKDRSGFYKEPFLGYPIYYDYNSDVIENSDLIIQFMVDHWKNLKAEKPLHGDFTHMNILINDRNQINVIDAKEDVDNSLISDHFYFYAYFLAMVKKHKNKDIVAYQKIKFSLENILRFVFQKEDKTFLINSLEVIDFNKFCMPGAKEFVHTFKKNVLKL
jgi:hypothetical protein